MNEQDRKQFELQANQVNIFNLESQLTTADLQDKRRYESEMANYVPMDGFTKGKRQKRKKDPNAPKRPQTAFFVYSAKVLDYYSVILSITFCFSSAPR